MVSKQHIKFIKSLQYKKYRRKANAFLVEGEKSVLELIRSDYEVVSVTATQDFFDLHEGLLERRSMHRIVADAAALAKMGSYQSNNSALAVAVPMQIRTFDVVPGDHILALQGIRDPGNLGTIIRTADWYGFDKIIASPDTVDVYNPKVVSATKGSFVRVHTLYQEIDTFIKEHPHMHVYGTFLRGRSLYDTTITAPSVIILGNESQGIDAALQGRIGHRLTIPRVGGAESLNVGVAAAIICDHIRRQDQQK